MSHNNGQAFSNSGSNFQSENDEPGGKEYQGSQKKREQTTVSQKTVKEESTKTEHHHSSFQSARSVFESTPGIQFSQTETISSSRTNTQSSVLQSFHCVNNRKHPDFVTFRSPENDKFGDHSPNKTPPDKPDRKSKTTSSKNESLASRPSDTLVEEVLQEKTCNNSILTTTTSIKETQISPQPDPMSVSR